MLNLYSENIYIQVAPRQQQALWTRSGAGVPGHQRWRTVLTQKDSAARGGSREIQICGGASSQMTESARGQEQICRVKCSFSTAKSNS